VIIEDRRREWQKGGSRSEVRILVGEEETSA
jgi:hypothetical protein